ncbi:hypothetical protein Btru_059305 [Bulinus truncatus]|nr:hypothetical protein Btru_059305 [Bulinus truncatus]
MVVVLCPDEVSNLYQACESGDVDMARSLLINILQEDPLVLQKESTEGLSPLAKASIHGSFQIVEMFLNYGAVIDMPDDQGKTTLIIATISGKSDVKTALMLAASKGDLNVVQTLLSFQVGVNIKSKYGSSALLSASHNGYAKVVQLLVEHGADISQKNSKSQTSLLVAAEKGFLNVVQVLFSKGSSLNSKDDEGSSALMLATKFGHFGVVNFILSKGINVNKSDHKGKTSFFHAAENGNIKILKKLLIKGADIDKPMFGGMTPLMKTCKKGLTDITEFLLQKHARVNETDIDGWTPLMFATENNYIDIVRMLVDYGANVLMKNKCQKTAFHISLKKGHKAIRDFLEETTCLHVQVLPESSTESISSSPKRQQVFDVQSLVMNAIQPRDTSSNAPVIQHLSLKVKNINIGTSVNTVIGEGSIINYSSDAAAHESISAPSTSSRNDEENSNAE